MDTSEEVFYRKTDNWVRIAQQLLFIYRDTRVPSATSLNEFLREVQLVAKAIREG